MCVTCLAMVLVACGGGHDTPSNAGGSPPTGQTAADAAIPPVDSVALAHDAWSIPEVIRRLREAGLAVSDSGRTVRRPELHAVGHVLHLGRGTLTVYLYSGRGARSRDAANLDTTLHGLPTLETPHYISSGNVIAILIAPNDATVERVTNALTARHTQGPP